MYLLNLGRVWLSGEGEKGTGCFSSRSNPPSPNRANTKYSSRLPDLDTQHNEIGDFFQSPLSNFTLLSSFHEDSSKHKSLVCPPKGESLTFLPPSLASYPLYLYPPLRISQRLYSLLSFPFLGGGGGGGGGRGPVLNLRYEKVEAEAKDPGNEAMRFAARVLGGGGGRGGCHAKDRLGRRGGIGAEEKVEGMGR